MTSPRFFVFTDFTPLFRQARVLIAVSAHGALVVAGIHQLFGASPVNEMTTSRNPAWFSRSVDVLQANGAVFSADILNALVVTLKVFGQTHFACVAMEEVVSSAGSADTASIAVKLSFVLVVIEFALAAEVLKKSS